jgi:hypothetical protein
MVDFGNSHYRSDHGMESRRIAAAFKRLDFHDVPSLDFFLALDQKAYE